MDKKWEWHRKYDPLVWKTTGPNKQRNLRNINYSLNEEDYLAPEDYEFDLILVEVISKSLEDLARYPTGHSNFKSAKEFIESEYLDMWCIAFGRNLDTSLIRKKANDIINIPEKRADYLRFCHDKQQGRYRTNRGKNENRGNHPKLPTDGVSSEGDTEL